MREAGRSADVSPISLSLIGLFKPRQVLLAEKQQQRNSTAPILMGKNQPESVAQLKPEQESVLAHSVALWLETKGFSKVLKRFLSSAQIQDDDWRSKALNLNEVFSKHVATSNDVHKVASPQKKQESLVVGSAQINGEVNGEKTESKKKKKRNKGGDALTESGKMPNEMATGEQIKKSITKGKQEKKDNEKNSDNAVEEKVSKKRSIDATEGADESNKVSKKRKRMAVDATENQAKVESVVEELKPKKSKGLNEGKDIQALNKEEISARDIAGVTKDDLENEVDKFSNSKSNRKQNGSSSEPKTMNPFQRVKIDEVKFADERLQDNSYWAKDGAEIGYGAKAQEVLGQVRGRDFRHEKTKKKRGSYRGGQIDLQSHSIKFDNSDDE